MIELSGPVEATIEGDSSVPIVAWEILEIFVTVVTVSVALLALGGLGKGIATTVNSTTLRTDQAVWNAIQFGAQWANVYLAAILFGALGLSLWQVYRWTDALNVAPNERDSAVAVGHVRRAKRMTDWVEVALALIAVGAIAEFIGQVGFFGLGNYLWPSVIGGGSEMLAVLLMAATGVFTGRRFQHRILDHVQGAG